LSPTATLTAVSVPLVEKLSEVVVDEATFAEAVWTDCTVPRATVAVCVTEAELPRLRTRSRDRNRPRERRSRPSRVEQRPFEGLPILRVLFIVGRCF